MPEEEVPNKKITILPEWRGDCGDPKVETVRIHPWARSISGFED